MDVGDAKAIVRAEIERLTPTPIDLSHSIHANPELNFEEHHAHEALTGVLDDNGIDVARGAYDMPTAFDALSAQNSQADQKGHTTMTITEAELDAARRAWGDGLVAISHAYEADGIDGARAVASRILDDAYGYGLGPVLFKPTMASGEQTFRPTKAGALSYFVGHDADYPLDGGFGLKGWRTVESETAASFVDGDVAMWMGWVTMTDKDGQVTKVDKSWGYTKDADGVLRIVLHHSSLPYQP